MRASRLPHPIYSYWASNVVVGVGRGTHSMLYGFLRGVGGVVYDPYIGCKEGGLVGGGIGVFKGLGGLAGRPIKGCFDFIAQPIVGLFWTPHYLYKRIVTKKDPT
jgi:hypothetical protein